jgi:putative transposase
MPMTKRLELAKQDYEQLSIRQRCRLLGVTRSQVYYQKTQGVDDTTATHMNEIREIYEKRPFQGYKRITDDLKEQGYIINHKRTYRLMKLMGLQAIYPKKNLSKRRQADAIHPYLLKDHPPCQPHDVWCTDITYIRTSHGYIYLTALIDVVSRFVVGYSVSTCLDTQNCLDALEMAISKGYKPKIINSDQGCQFTSQEWAYSLTLLGVKISMDGKGRCLDNIPIERFWRTIKYEEVYLNTYDSVAQARAAISQYIQWYNHERRHTGINKHKPYEVMMGLKQATDWPFANKNTKADGYGDNCKQLTHISTASTATTKQQINILLQNHSSTLAA